MADILPDWVVMGRRGIIGAIKLPYEDERCPLFVLLREYITEPEKTVSWSITFAFHALLTAILEVEPIFDRLVEVSLSTFHNYFEQLNYAKTLASNNPESLGTVSSREIQSFWRNMISVTFLENFGLPVYGPPTMFNPLCAGTIFSYLSYFGNLDCGIGMIDCQAQLRVALHLFHALLMNGIVRKGEIPLLDMLYDNFRNSKAVWQGSLPKKGEFGRRFWICWGVSTTDARHMSEDAKESFRKLQRKPYSRNRKPQPEEKRKLLSFEASEISRSYRRICNHDFHDVVDKCHTPEQRRKYRDTDFYRLTVNTNDTLEAIEDEQTLLSLNLPSFSAVIEQFVNSLGRVLQWEELMEFGVRGRDQNHRQAFAFLFAQYLLGAMDFADDPFGYKFLDIPQGQTSSEFMTAFFCKAPTSKLFWFESTNKHDRKAKISAIN